MMERIGVILIASVVGTRRDVVFQLELTIAVGVKGL
jgi:hypothetical protein